MKITVRFRNQSHYIHLTHQDLKALHYNGLHIASDQFTKLATDLLRWRHNLKES